MPTCYLESVGQQYLDINLASVKTDPTFTACRDIIQAEFIILALPGYHSRLSDSSLNAVFGTDDLRTTTKQAYMFYFPRSELQVQ